MVITVLPAPIEERAIRHRGALTEADIELVDLAATPAVHPDAATVLLAGILPDDADALVHAFRRLRNDLPAGVTLRIVDEERPLRPESGARRVVGRLRGRGDARSASIVEALRTAGWTVASVERIEVADTPTRLWVDLSAVDLSTISARSGEGDRDQRSE